MYKILLKPWAKKILLEVTKEMCITAVTCAGKKLVEKVFEETPKPKRKRTKK